MRALFGIAGLIVAGVLIWQIGARLSTDAVGMGVGLVFGVLAGIPAALLVLATDRRTDDGDAYSEGYRAGVQDTTDLARGMARQLPEHQPTVIVVHPPADDDEPEIYTPAYPFGRRQFRITGEVE